MIQFNLQTPALGRQAPVASGPRPSTAKEVEAPQDGVSLQTVSIPCQLEAPQACPVHPGKLGETGFTSALQALPAEGAAARLLNSTAEIGVPPMTEHQREVCIQGLETLNLAGYLKSLDPFTMEHQNCTVAEALASMANGDSVFYRDGKQGPLTEIGGLEKLSAVAEKARYRIVG